MILIKTEQLPKNNSKSGWEKKRKKKKNRKKGDEKMLGTRSRESGRGREGGGLQL